ncbi:DUF6000 family protein [Polluticaenibacter yanchengensis]|uniref:DUF6000 family protein n=1 Tax=Polluticaenibacter yanchengensis TaxID=3014562 RepID=A0ABT4UNC8_9BACT|nr:DUF6000 family protein [Chitinophagaceae bacterium LY-5]
MEDINEQIRLHTAGATIRHESFDDLPSYENAEELSQEFIDTWVVPFYMDINNPSAYWKEQFIQISNNITKDIVLKLLGDFNWRTRQTGAFFAAIKGFKDLTEIIGIHLLKSEVCYAGVAYTRTLASFNTENAVEYLDRYLSHYLLQPDLWFDQHEALEALTYLDKINNTKIALKHNDNWTKFLENKPHWNKNITTDIIEVQLSFIEEIKLKS